MNLTIEQVKTDIKSGKSKRIYYSAATLWWTHLDDDLIQARDVGHKAQEERHMTLMLNPNVPEIEKQRIESLWNLVKNSENKMPLDPTGAPLYQTDDCMQWIVAAEKKPEHFGKDGLKAFMKSHHQNCNGKCFSKWIYYNA